MEPKIHTRETFSGGWAAILSSDMDLDVFVVGEGSTEQEALDALRAKLDG